MIYPPSRGLRVGLFLVGSALFGLLVHQTSARWPDLSPETRALLILSVVLAFGQAALVWPWSPVKPVFSGQWFGVLAAVLLVVVVGQVLLSGEEDTPDSSGSSGSSGVFWGIVATEAVFLGSCLAVANLRNHHLNLMEPFESWVSSSQKTRTPLINHDLIGDEPHVRLSNPVVE